MRKRWLILFLAVMLVVMTACQKKNEDTLSQGKEQIETNESQENKEIDGNDRLDKDKVDEENTTVEENSSNSASEDKTGDLTKKNAESSSDQAIETDNKKENNTSNQTSENQQMKKEEIEKNDQDKKETKLTKKQAIQKLEDISHQKLGLPSKLSSYSIEVDEWFTNIEEKECYGISVYSKTDKKLSLIGTYYVATDGSAQYRFDPMQDMFVELK